ncbi:hypothetical protein ABLN97_00820 [Mycobacterium tuberculosis]
MDHQCHRHRRPARQPLAPLDHEGQRREVTTADLEDQLDPDDLYHACAAPANSTDPRFKVASWGWPSRKLAWPVRKYGYPHGQNGFP